MLRAGEPQGKGSGLRNYFGSEDAHGEDGATAENEGLVMRQPLGEHKMPNPF